MLFKLIAKNIVQRPLRYLLTGFAVIFSVAAVCSVFIFTDGLRTTFDELATNIESGYDISVQPNTSFGDGVLAPTVPVELVDVISATDGVASVSPRVVGFGVVAVDGQGEPTLAASGPNLGVLWGDDEGSASRYFVQSGRRPAAPDEFALDIDSFAEGDYELGERYTLQIPAATGVDEPFELTGTFTFGDPEQNAIVGARIVGFDDETAVNLVNGGGGYSDITLAIDDGADLDTVVANLESTVGSDAIRVLTQDEVIERTQGDFGQILDIFRTVLLVFAVIILLVSAFLIYNVFSITLGQRIRELGLLRAVGAFGSQVTAMMLGEALLLGVIATIVGIPAGMGMAWLLRAALTALGFPDDTGLPLNALTVIVAIITGVVVTALSALWPAIQARRVTPIAALRDGAAMNDLSPERDVPTGMILIGVGVLLGFLTTVFDGWLPALGLPVVAGVLFWLGLLRVLPSWARIALFAVGVGILLVVLFGEFDLGTTFGLLGAGTLLMLIGAIQIAPYLAAPLTSILGRAPTAVIVALLGIVIGLASVGAVLGSIAIAITGTPDAIIDAAESDVPRGALITPLLFLSALLAPLAYGMVRTALGSRGLTGRIARANSARNPQRTATTAAALMIGLTLVTAVTVIGDSIKTSVSSALSSSITADWLLQGPQSGPQGLPFSVDAAASITELDEIESVLQFRSAFPAAWVTSETGELDASDLQRFLPIILELVDDASNLTPERALELQQEIGTDIEVNEAIAVDFDVLDDHIDPDFIDRDPSLIGPNAVYLEAGVAEDKGLEVGDTFSALFVDLQSEDLVVAGIFDNGFVLGNRVMTLEMWNRHFPSDSDVFLTAVTASGVTPDEARSAMTDALEADFPVIEVLDKEEFAEQAERQINQTLATVNVLLGLSAIIAFLGILVALALSVFERTREIGLFRAVGTTTSQTRWMIRWEGVIVAAFGGLLGIALGIGLGMLTTSKMPEFIVNQTSVPFGSLIFYLIFAAVVGLVAAVFPAWIAGRMNVLDAISSE